MSDASAGVVSCESTARCARGSPAARAPTKLRTATVGCIGKRCPESRARARESLRTAVSSCGIAAVAGLAAEGRAHPAHPLLGDLDRVERAPQHVEREGANLAEHVLGADGVRVLVDEEHAPLRAPRLLVRHAREDDVAGELLPGRPAREERHDDRAHGRHVLHVDGPPPPEVTVRDLARERGVGPGGRVGLDHVEVGVQEERRLLSRPADARDHARAPRLGLVQRRLDARLAEVVREALGGRALVTVRPLLEAAVDGRDANEVAEEREALVSCLVDNRGRGCRRGHGGYDSGKSPPGVESRAVRHPRRLAKSAFTLQNPSPT